MALLGKVDQICSNGIDGESGSDFSTKRRFDDNRTLRSRLCCPLHCPFPFCTAASLPILFVDGLKLHHLNYRYAFFPGAAGCIILCLIQEVVSYLKENFQF